MKKAKEEAALEKQKKDKEFINLFSSRLSKLAEESGNTHTDDDMAEVLRRVIDELLQRKDPIQSKFLKAEPSSEKTGKCISSTGNFYWNEVIEEIERQKDILTEKISDLEDKHGVQLPDIDEILIDPDYDRYPQLQVIRGEVTQLYFSILYAMIRPQLGKIGYVVRDQSEQEYDDVQRKLTKHPSEHGAKKKEAKAEIKFRKASLAEQLTNYETLYGIQFPNFDELLKNLPHYYEEFPVLETLKDRFSELMTWVSILDDDQKTADGPTKEEKSTTKNETPEQNIPEEYEKTKRALQEKLRTKAKEEGIDENLIDLLLSPEGNVDGGIPDKETFLKSVDQMSTKQVRETMAKLIKVAELSKQVVGERLADMRNEDGSKPTDVNQILADMEFLFQKFPHLQQLFSNSIISDHHYRIFKIELEAAIETLQDSDFPTEFSSFDDKLDEYRKQVVDSEAREQAMSKSTSELLELMKLPTSRTQLEEHLKQKAASEGVQMPSADEFIAMLEHQLEKEDVTDMMANLHKNKQKEAFSEQKFVKTPRFEDLLDMNFKEARSLDFDDDVDYYTIGDVSMSILPILMFLLAIFWLYRRNNRHDERRYALPPQTREPAVIREPIVRRIHHRQELHHVENILERNIDLVLPDPIPCGKCCKSPNSMIQPGKEAYFKIRCHATHEIALHKDCLQKLFGSNRKKDLKVGGRCPMESCFATLESIFKVQMDVALTEELFCKWDNPNERNKAASDSASGSTNRIQSSSSSTKPDDRNSEINSEAEEQEKNDDENPTSAANSDENHAIVEVQPSTSKNKAPLPLDLAFKAVRLERKSVQSVEKYASQEVAPVKPKKLRNRPQKEIVNVVDLQPRNLISRKRAECVSSAATSTRSYHDRTAPSTSQEEDVVILDSDEEDTPIEVLSDIDIAVLAQDLWQTRIEAYEKDIVYNMPESGFSISELLDNIVLICHLSKYERRILDRYFVSEEHVKSFVRQTRYFIVSKRFGELICGRSKAGLDLIRTETAKKLANAVDEEDNSCAICFDPLDEMKDALSKCPKCRKFLHTKCVEVWLLKEQTCPLCRENWPSDIHFPKLC